MPPLHSSLDPDGHYARLGLTPGASREAIAAAYRAKARVLHPDVPGTGDAGAFVAVKQAYDILSNPDRRESYDRTARRTTMEEVQPEVFVIRPAPVAAPVPTRNPRLSDMPILVWLSLGAFLAIGITEVVLHLNAGPAKVEHTAIRPNAASVTPLSADARQEVLYGPAPAHLPGTPNFYVTPAAGPATLFRLDQDHNTLVPIGQLPPFSSVQALRLYRRIGMLEVRLNDDTNGFIPASHLTPGNTSAARSAYCGYHAGPVPADGEILHRGLTGNTAMEIENHSLQPAVVKLRNEHGVVAASVFIAAGSEVQVSNLPAGLYYPEYGIGELWSRACNTFAFGLRAKRTEIPVTIPGGDPLVIPGDIDTPGLQDMPDDAFEKE